MTVTETLRAATLVILVCFALIDDSRNYRISNKIIAAGGGMCCALAAVSCIYDGGCGVGFDMLLGGGISLAFGFAAYMMRGIGAGDAKLLMVCGMLVGYDCAAAMLMLSCVAGVIGGVAEAAFGSGKKLAVNGVNVHGTHFSIGILIGNVCTLILKSAGLM